uniref:C2H2-type domain-containing protein n=1 Tax=Leersia perrieri TaxID=77586 RepID=A0A0D9V9B1_9ORYZ
METNMGFWGIVVRPGETVKCDPPGELYYHISQIALEPGELSENVHVFVEVDGDESDEEVPLAIPLYPRLDDDKVKEAQHSPSKLSGHKYAAAAASPIPEVVVPERKNYGKRKADDKVSDEEDGDDSGVGESDDDEDSSDDGESSDEEETPLKGKNRPVETPLKTPPQKKMKLATPIMSKAGTGTSRSGGGYVHVATPHPAKQAKKTAGNNDMFKKSAGYVHVATPHPAKRTPANNDMSKHSDGYACKSCNKTFNSSMGLEAHSKAKHT